MFKHYIVLGCLGILACTIKAQHLEKLGEFAVTNGYANDIAIVGSTCYLATSKGIEIIDISDPANINALGKAGFDFVDETGLSIGVRSNQYVYLGSNYALHLFDVSDNENPYGAKRNTINGEVENMVADQNRVFITRNNFGFSIVDIADPLASPIVSGRYSGGSNPWIRGLHIDGKTAYVTKYIDNVLLILDITDVSSVALKKSFSIPSLGQANTPKLYNVTTAGTHAFLAGGQNGLVIADISSLGNISIAGSILDKSQGYGIVDVAVKDNYAYAADAESGIRIVNISNPASPQTETTVSVASGISRIKRIGNRLFCINNSTSNSKVIIYDIKSGEPTAVAETEQPQQHFKVYPQPADQQLNITAGSYNSIKLYDIRGHEITLDRSNPAHINTVNMPDGIYMLVANTADSKQYVKKITIKH